MRRRSYFALRKLGRTNTEDDTGLLVTMVTVCPSEYSLLLLLIKLIFDKKLFLLK